MSTRFPNDPIMQGLESKIGPFSIIRCESAWEALASAIIFQQVSGKVAAKICERIVGAYGRFPKPEDVALMPEGWLRTFGITERKEKTIRALATAIKEGKLDLAELSEKHESILMSVLTSFNGIGKWTVEMWMVFHLQREDVFMPGDLGLRKAIAQQYGLPAPPTPEEALAFAERWRPHRTIASWYLWKSLPGFPEPGFGRGWDRG